MDTAITASRDIRVFLSSTFADMQGERDYLVKKIFPAIKRECLRRNVEFTVLDLRWGITGLSPVYTMSRSLIPIRSSKSLPHRGCRGTKSSTATSR